MSYPDWVECPGCRQRMPIFKNKIIVHNEPTRETTTLGLNGGTPWKVKIEIKCRGSSAKVEFQPTEGVSPHASGR